MSLVWVSFVLVVECLNRYQILKAFHVVGLTADAQLRRYVVWLVESKFVVYLDHIEIPKFLVNVLGLLREKNFVGCLSKLFANTALHDFIRLGA